MVPAGRITGDHGVVLKPGLEFRVNPAMRFASAIILGDSRRKSGVKLHRQAPEKFGQGFSQRLSYFNHNSGNAMTS